VGHGATGTLGAHAEQAAFRHLVDNDLRPIARNFRCRGGELDLVMLDGDCLVIVEVRYRKSSRFAAPAITVDRHKQRKLVRTAALFAARNRRFASLPMRFDVVAVEGSTTPAIRWIRDAFRPDDSMF
jgi:putative endonuclease